ncbi:hypothetical protein FDZ71_02360 [bacterium]|nr:MAG: hypothetical protein FDZ71_02360 [bacterium]
MIRVMEKLKRVSATPEGYPAYLLTHPEPEARITYLERELGPEPAKSSEEPYSPFDLALARSSSFAGNEWARAAAMAKAQKHRGECLSAIGAAALSRGRGEFGPAEKFLAEASSSCGDNPRFIHEEAMLKAARGEISASRALLEKIISQNPADFAAIKSAVRLACEAGDFKEAKILLEKFEAGGGAWDKLIYYKGMALGGLGLTSEGFALLGEHYAYSDPPLALNYYRKAIAGPLDAERKEALKKEIERLVKEVSAAQKSRQGG